MISLRTSLVVKCDTCPSSYELPVVLAPHRLRQLLDGAEQFVLESDELPVGWATHRSGGWGATDYTKTQLVCAGCLPGWKQHGRVVVAGTRGPMTEIAAAARDATRPDPASPVSA